MVTICDNKLSNKLLCKYYFKKLKNKNQYQIRLSAALRIVYKIK